MRPTLARVLPLAVALAATGLVSRSAGAAPGDPVVAGAPVVEATFQSIGVTWPVTGDANRNAGLTLEFRRIGDATWRAGAVAMKAEPTTIVDGAPLGLHQLAASALLLDPGTGYELRATLTDPDGGGAQQVLAAATRTEPQADPAGRRRAVVPGTGGGDGSPGNPFRGTVAAMATAQAGDVFELAPGAYAPFVLAANGTSAEPIVVRGPADGSATIDGGNTDRGVVTLGSIATGGAYLIVEHLTIQNGHWGIDADSTRSITIRGNVIRDVDFGVVNRREAGVEHDQTIVDNLIVGRTPWPGVGIPEEQGMELRGDGNVVGWNRIRDFGDCISLQPKSGRSYGNDVVGNDVSECVDDGIQVDYNEANVRVWRNRVTNARMGVSVQPVRGGPAYVFRNEFSNLESNPIKMNNNPSGFVVVQNTSVKDGPGLYDPAETWRNAIFRNNLMLGTGYAFEFTTVPDEGFRDFDYDAWGTTRAGTTGDPWFKWNNVRYASIAELRGAGVETHGIATSVGDLTAASYPVAWDTAVVPGSGDLRPRAGTAPVDAGTALANVNDGFVVDGKPDMGAYELGQARPPYGPRSGLGAPAPSTPSRFVSYGPARQLDTRNGDQGGRHPGGRTTRAYTLRDVPAAATAVTLNVTAVSPAAGGYLSVFGCGGAVPATSSLNYQTDRVATPNQVTVAAANGQVCVLSQQATDLVVDLAGWWLPAGDAELAPDQARLWDTRTQGGGAAGSVLVVDLTSRAAAWNDVTGVSVNVTATDANAAGFLTAYDCDTPRPLASNVNVTPGLVTANHATVSLRSPARKLCVYTLQATGIVVDLTGWWRTGTGARRLTTPPTPERRLDTRVAGGLTGRLVGGRAVTVVAPSARPLFANVTVDAGAASGWVAVYPCGQGYRGTSTVNFRAGQPVANAALVDASSGVCALANVAVDLVLDVFGELA